MRLSQRAAKLADALPPKAAVLLWLEEAHQFPTLSAYAAWLLDQPKAARPSMRIPEQVKAAVKQAMASARPPDIWAATKKGERESIFLVTLVLRLNHAAEEILRSEDLRFGLLYWQLRALTLADRLRDRATPGSPSASGPAERWQLWQTGNAGLIGTLYEAEAVRLELEQTYLDGHPALFPETIAEWARLLQCAERLAGLESPESSEPDFEALCAAAQDRAATTAACLADERVPWRSTSWALICAREPSRTGSSGPPCNGSAGVRSRHLVRVRVGRAPSYRCPQRTAEDADGRGSDAPRKPHRCGPNSGT